MITPTDFDWDDQLIDATRSDCDPRVRVYIPHRVAVVLGRGSSAETEVRLGEVQQDGVALLKRRGGGCSVVLDEGNVVVSTVHPLSGFGGIPRAFNRISDWVIDALESTGVKGVHQAGISDLAVGDSKIGGACIYRTRGLLYYSATLLYSPNLDFAERYLKHPPREPDYRRGRTHRDFMGSLNSRCSSTDILSFVELMRQSLRCNLDLLHDDLRTPITTQGVLT